MTISNMVRWRSRSLLLLAGALAAVALLAACSGSNGDPAGESAASRLDAQVESLGMELRAIGTPVGSTSGRGIHAAGSGVAVGQPDIAVLSMGAESLGTTVTEARQDAALAIDGILRALRAAGVDDDDIETQYFSIQPRYEYPRDGGPRLIGYQVTNTLTVTVRDLDNVGAIIDNAVEAGGDAARVNGITFSVEDGAALEHEARLLALQDAVAKADLYAEQLGVSRGKLAFVTESSFSQYPQETRALAISDSSAAFAPTQILPGEFEVRVNVQAVFEIE